LTAYASSPRVHDELDYWLTQSAMQIPELPTDVGDGRNTEAEAASATTQLTAAETHAVLRDVPRVHRARINAVLLTALARAFAAWTGRSELLVNLEGHGREPIAEGVDLSRTIGWFTTMFPLRLQLTGKTSATADLSAIREQLRSLPRQGIGYGVLRYMATDSPRIAELRGQAWPRISFNYLGQFDQTLPSSGALRFTSLSSGPVHSSRQVRAHDIDIIAVVLDGQLRLSCTYSQQMHSAPVMQRAIDGVAAQLRDLIAASSPSTPPAAEFPLAGLDQERMAALLSKVGRRPGQTP
jgi:non-ribosomal peptide synthase protein (TIGR01720 family)